MLTLTRKYTFFSQHRLHSPRLDEATNRAVYGKCNNPGGHGHNYGVEITVGGKIDSNNGMLIHLDDLDGAVHRALDDQWDHHDLNSTLGSDFITTGENLVREIFRSVANELPDYVELARVKLHETRKNTFVYFGNEEGRPSSLANKHPSYL